MRGYIVYMILIALITIPIFTTTIMQYQEEQNFESIQHTYKYFCHQLTSRSYCYFPDKGSVEDCYVSSEFKESKESKVMKDGFVGYKFPVCARDVGFYVFALIGGLFLFTTGRHVGKIVPHPFWLIITLIPMGLDGGTQYIGLRESTNTLRLITGAIAGIVLPFYVVPILNRIIK